MSETKPGFTIFRGSEAPALHETGAMSVEPGTATQREGMGKMLAAGFREGDTTKLLCNIPGFSLTHAWFRKDFPLPLHTHDSNCLYFIVAGSLRLGTEALVAGDSFFVPGGVPYTYRPGPDGVEVLEFRHETQFNFVNMAKGAAFYDKAAETIAGNLDAWRTAPRPSERQPVPAPDQAGGAERRS